MQKNSESRSFPLDLIRAAAIISVVACHFFSLNTDFRDQPFVPGVEMFIKGMADFFFLFSVPFFLMLSGYLNGKKREYSWKYVWGMRRVIFSYLIFSVLTILFRRIYMGEEKSWLQLFAGILNFTAIPYAWYIEMWIGLYLLTPMLNRAYDAFEGNQKQILWLISVLALLSVVPSFTNRYNLYIFPEFWKGIFPIFYFYAGRYIRDFKPTVKSWILIVTVVVLCSINPLVTCFISDGVHPLVYIAGAPHGLLGAILSISLFILFLRLGDRIQNPSIITSRAITRLSMMSLDMYLCSFMVDKFVYPLTGPVFFVAVPAVIIISYATAELKNLVFRL